jgi:hypothetical protein
MHLDQKLARHARASINRTGKSNAAKGVENHYNEHSEFHAREIEAHICSSFMKMNGMRTPDGIYSLIKQGALEHFLHFK